MVLHLKQGGFNTQPPEGGWRQSHIARVGADLFQHTAARRRLGTVRYWPIFHAGFNTQPPVRHKTQVQSVSTHSRPKAAGQPAVINKARTAGFQHTAARRRLGTKKMAVKACIAVSTHSRPKAAGKPQIHPSPQYHSFNTQPPEGGWMVDSARESLEAAFQHTAARRRLALCKSRIVCA